MVPPLSVLKIQELPEISLLNPYRSSVPGPAAKCVACTTRALRIPFGSGPGYIPQLDNIKGNNLCVLLLFP